MNYNNYKLTIIIYLIILSSNVRSQSGNNILNILPPSPTASELTKIGLVSSNLVTGTISTQIPLYTYSTPNLKLPLTLTYNSDGLKVNQIASRVGLGWSLNIGGIISRSVLGKPDDLVTRLHVPSDFPGTSGIAGSNFVTAALGQGSDIQPDIYTYNFSGGSGSFFIDENNNLVKLEENNLVIKNFNYSGFTIITADGIIYSFSAIEKSTYSNNC